MTRSLVLEPTDSDDEVALADWLETTMLVEQSSYISRAKIRKHIRSLFAEDQPDVVVEILLREIGRRKRQCEGAYPFEQAKTGVRQVSNKGGTAYLFMLCISASKPYRDEHRQSDTDELFDSLVLDALLNYLGKGSQGVRFGAPGSDGRPANFRDAINWLAKMMNLPAGAGHPRKTGGDRGLDVIAWRPFRDKRSGYIVLLAQCTVQRDWVGKAKDLDCDAWRGWIDLGKDPHLILAIPSVVARDYDKWDEVRRIVHSVLDRLRLTELLGGVKLKREGEIRTWIASEIVRMGGVR